MFGIFIALWGFVVLMALAIIFWASYVHGWIEARKKRKWQREQRGGDGGPIATSRGLENEKGGVMPGAMPDFMSMPSPKYEAYDSHQRSNATAADNRSDEESAMGRFISRPMKLMAIGKKALGKERPIGDKSRGLYGEEKEGATLLNRVKGLFWKDAGTPEEPIRSGPVLHISANLESDVNTVTAPNLNNNPNSRDYVPPSAWSISPVAREHTPKPWAQRIIPTKKFNHPSLSSSSNASPRSKPGLESPMNDDENISLDIPPMKPTPLAVPLHHGFYRREGSRSPPPASSPVYPTHFPNPLRPPIRVPPPRIKGRRDNHRRSASVPQETATTRKLTQTHGRKSSATLDPFATPFDDEHAAVPFPDRRGGGVNPFIAI